VPSYFTAKSLYEQYCLQRESSSIDTTVADDCIKKVLQIMFRYSIAADQTKALLSRAPLMKRILAPSFFYTKAFS
jgi:hypothetical protein